MQNSAGASSAQFIKMTQTPIPKLIVTLAAPTVASMLVSSIYKTQGTLENLNISAPKCKICPVI